MKKLQRKCECCKKELLIVMGNQRFCSSCSIHNQNIKYQIDECKRKLKNLQKKYDDLKPKGNKDNQNDGR